MSVGLILMIFLKQILCFIKFMNFDEILAKNNKNLCDNGKMFMVIDFLK